MNSRSDKTTSDRKYCPLHGKMAKNGFYFRTSDSKKIERWKCLDCGKTCSQATGTACFGQNKRRVNSKRIDGRKRAMLALFSELREVLSEDAELTSDKKTSYPGWLRQVSPTWRHIRVKGRKPCHVGQGELKEGGYDPLFYLNHTCAMIRDSVKRLARRSWCTTKKMENLANHLDIYRDFHNEVLVA